MKKTAVVIDSTVYMSADDIIKNNFYVIPLTVNFENVKYTEAIEDQNQVEEVFNRITATKKLPQTSQPSTNDALSLFADIKSVGYEKIVCLHLSSELSGTMQGMRLAANQFMEENADIEILVFDSRSAAQASSVIAREVAKHVKKNGTIEESEVEQIIKFYDEHMETFVFVDNLDYLAFGGRIPATMASIGNLFGITPIITLNDGGGLEKYKAERSQKKAIASILKLFKEQNFTSSDKIILHGFYTTEDKMAKRFLKEATKHTEATIVDTDLTQMGIVISNHLGPKSFGIFWSKVYE